MSRPAATRDRARLHPGLVVAIAGVVALAVFVAANAHLIYVAFASQPECVAHLKDPGGGAGFRAAKSAC